MAMTITLELPPHLEAQLRASLSRGDPAAPDRLRRRPQATGGRARRTARASELCGVLERGDPAGGPERLRPVAGRRRPAAAPGRTTVRRTTGFAGGLPGVAPAGGRPRR